MDNKEVKDYWNACYDVLLKERTKRMNEFNKFYAELQEIQKDIMSIDASLDKMLEIGTELKFIS